MIGMALKASVVDPGYFLVVLELLCDLKSAVADSIHAQRQRFDTLEDQKCIKGRDCGSGISQRHDTRAADIRRRPERLGVHHAVITDVGLVESSKALFVLGPGKLTGIHDGAADARSMAPKVLGERVYDDVCAVFDGLAQIRSGYRIVDDQGHAVTMGNLGDTLEVRDVALWFSYLFHEHRLC